MAYVNAFFLANAYENLAIKLVLAKFTREKPFLTNKVLCCDARFNKPQVNSESFPSVVNK